ncbi:MAG TPA: hypothetical protein PK795_10020, partial [Bacillota bacterium]|nr:hypothetical protein [Bacillota bacterium]
PNLEKLKNCLDKWGHYIYLRSGNHRDLLLIAEAAKRTPLNKKRLPVLSESPAAYSALSECW